MAAATSRRPLAEWPQAVRRIAVAGLYASYAAGAFLAFAFDGAAGWAGAALIALSAAILMVLITRSDFWRRGHGADTELDERERRVRERAYFHGYVLIATLSMSGILWLQLGPQYGLWTPQATEDWMVLYWGWALLCLTLPSAVQAWGERTAE